MLLKTFRTLKQNIRRKTLICVHVQGKNLCAEITMLKYVLHCHHLDVSEHLIKANCIFSSVHTYLYIFVYLSYGGVCLRSSFPASLLEEWEKETGSKVRQSPLSETHSHSHLSTTTDYFSAHLRLRFGLDLDLNARFGSSIYSQHCFLFYPHLGSRLGCSFCVFARTILVNLPLYSEVTGDFGQYPGCLQSGRLCF